MNQKTWQRRFAERIDLTTNLAHLTKPTTTASNIVDVLLQILAKKKLIGSTTSSGFIVGEIPAVCLQDTPIYSLAQNVYYEQKLRESNKKEKIRYIGAGLLFSKDEVYKKGGRPVIYDQTVIAKKYLPESEWWRIVNFNLEDDNNVIDWSHEREWRVPNELSFELDKVVVLLPNYKAQKEFINKFEKKFNECPLKLLRGLIVLRQVFL